MADTRISGLARAARESFRAQSRRKSNDKGNAKLSRGSSAWTLADIQKALPQDAIKQHAERAGPWEFDPANLKNLKQIGSGNFGKVFVGTAVGILKGEKQTRVAVKTLTSKGSKVEQEFLQEAGIMQSIDGPHQIVRLLGVCTKKKPMYMIMEFMSRGDLKEVLRHSRPKKGKASQLSLHQLTKMAADIAEGMAYLASAKIVHRDLAARNCLVAEDYSVKVGDFGLTRDVYASEYYRMTGAAALPIRWMAPESLNDGVFTTATDVWSFGVVLWEIMTFGKVPYPTMDNEQVIEQVCDEEYRMPCPERCPAAIYDMMRQCWEEEPEDRATFAQLYASLLEMTGAISKAPVVRAGDDNQKEVVAATYSVPQDTVPTFADEDSAAEEEYDPYGLTGVDMSTYSLCGEDLPQDDDDDDDDTGAEETYSLATTKSKGPEAVTAKSSTPARQGEAADDEDDDDDPVVYATEEGSIQSDTTLAAKSKSTRGLTAQEQEDDVIAWTERMLGQKNTTESLYEWLKSGEVLCRLMNVIKPNSIDRYNLNTKRAFKQMENIGRFLEACAAYGVPVSDRFVTKDLFEQDNMRRVVNCIASLKKTAESKGVGK
eukprot:m.62656 g.62656  ORF g.62656 m.62656 type:complete len:600 (-) comp13411_c0_seq1:72-1871(-)